MEGRALDSCEEWQGVELDQDCFEGRAEDLVGWGAGEETRKGGWTEADSKLADCGWGAPFAVRSAYHPFSK